VITALAGRSLAEVESMTRMPQVLVNVTVADRDAIAAAKKLWDAVEREQARLEGRGRVLVRSSGTEPLVRVMVEARQQAEAEEVCRRLVDLVRAELG
jgi:phosphoglucosamine mutase